MCDLAAIFEIPNDYEFLAVLRRRVRKLGRLRARIRECAFDEPVRTLPRSRELVRFCRCPPTMLHYCAPGTNTFERYESLVRERRQPDQGLSPCAKAARLIERQRRLPL